MLFIEVLPFRPPLALLAHALDAVIHISLPELVAREAGTKGDKAQQHSFPGTHFAASCFLIAAAKIFALVL
jgi:hypothetical protein